MREESQLVLDAIAGKRANPQGIIRANCPYCEEVVHKVDRKSCLSLNVDTGWYRCYRCSSEGRISDEEMPHDTSTIIKRDRVVEEVPVELPEGFTRMWLPEGQKGIVFMQARQYLRKDRIGVTKEIMEAAQIGACARGDFRNRVVVPIFKAGKLAGYVGRLWWKKPPPGSLTYRYSKGFGRADTLYNEEALYVQTDEPVIVVEGVFDTFPFWPHAVAVLGKPSYQQKKMMLDERVTRPIFIVFDGDAHREATALAMMLRLKGKRVHALRLLPGVDPDEVKDHVNERARAAFGTVCEQATG